MSDQAITLENADRETLNTALVFMLVIAQLQRERIQYQERLIGAYELVVRKKPRGRPKKNAPKGPQRGRGRPPKWLALDKQLDALQKELAADGEATTRTDAACELVRRLLPSRANPRQGRQVRELRREIVNLVKRDHDKRARAARKPTK